MGIPIVRRLAGLDRFGTASEVAQEMVNRGKTGGDSLEVFVTNGHTFADALAVAPVAAATGRPILLVKADAVPDATAEFLTDNEVAGITVVGGTGSVQPAVYDSIGAADRLHGANRYLTAAAVAAYGIDQLDMSSRVIGLASGVSFADALTAGPHLAAGRRVMLLTQPDRLSDGTKTFLTARKDSLARIIAIGGTGAIADQAFDEARHAIR